MPYTSRKAYLDKHHRFTIKEEEVPGPGPHEVIIKIEANGICGSDVHFYSEGRLGNFIVSEPYIPGHECSGIVIEAGSGVKSISAGDHVTVEPGIPCGKCGFCRGGRYNLCREVVFLSAPPVNGTFCDYLCIRADMVYRIPKTISFQEGAMMEPAAVAVHAVNRARFENGCTGAVIGAGPIGLLTMQAFKAAGGGKVISLDINNKRLKFAADLGADEVANPMESGGNLAGIADVVFETAGSDKATASLFGYVRSGGCAVQIGWPGSNIVGMDIAQFIEKELDYIAVNRYANAYPAAIQWVCDGRIDVKKIITHRYDFDRIEEAFEFTRRNPDEVIKTVVINKP